MTGGEIFHEMMLRQGVKHICMFMARSFQSCMSLLVKVANG